MRLPTIKISVICNKLKMTMMATIRTLLQIINAMSPVLLVWKVQIIWRKFAICLGTMILRGSLKSIYRLWKTILTMIILKYLRVLLKWKLLIGPMEMDTCKWKFLKYLIQNGLELLEIRTMKEIFNKIMELKILKL
jgi:hypothetical protein